MKSECPCNKAPGVTIVPMGNQQVGIVGLDSIFEEWSSAGKTPGDMEDAEILASVRKRNYVNPKAEKKYTTAIRAAYALYCRKK